MDWKKYEGDFLLFLETGFIAVNQADEDASLKLFRAAEMLKPTNTLPKVGFGYLHLHKLELIEASKCFEEVLRIEPGNEMAKAFLGLTMSLMPTELSKGEKVLAEMTKSGDPMIKTLASTALDFVDRFVKTTPGPAEKRKP